MAVSKRLRFEVLRRDNHACRYCGASAPDAVLTVDHVIPVTLGGTDDPGNLAAACSVCNAGKSSSSPDAPLVDDAAENALRWSKAMVLAHEAHRKPLRTRISDRAGFRENVWDRWTYRSGIKTLTVDLPPGWENSIDRFFQAGVTLEDFTEAVRIAMTSKARDTFSYMCGVLWKWVGERQEIAFQILEKDEHSDAQGAIISDWTDGAWQMPDGQSNGS
jgi:hypothetical protein